MRLIVSALSLAAAAAAPATRVSVDCGGGNTRADFSTLAAARDFIRTHLQPLARDVVVEVSGVCRPGHADTPVLELTSEDSGRAGRTITYAGGTVDGGVRIPASCWRPVGRSDIAPPILECDLTTLGAPSVLGRLGYGDYANGALGACTHTKVELVYAGTPMVVARWPNVPPDVEHFNGPWKDWLTIHNAQCGIDTTACFTTTSVGSSPRRAAWVAQNYTQLAAEGNAVWAHGFWTYDWADNYVRVEKVMEGVGGMLDISFADGTPPVYGLKAGARFYVANLLSELDAPGEYYVDAASHVVYFYPPDGTASPTDVVLTVASMPLVQLGAGVSHVAFERMALAHGRAGAIHSASGRALYFANITVRGFGGSGVTVSGGADVSLVGVDVDGVACKGIVVGGGDPTTLTPANITVADASVRNFARLTRTYNGAVAFSGVGLSVTRTSVGPGPHTGMTGSCNDCVFSDNIFKSLCFEARDCGAFYIGRSWVHRGVVVARNTFVNISQAEQTALGAADVTAMYLDDQQSGVVLVDNTCVRSMLCVLLGGGRDNVLTGNRCVDPATHCLHFDARGLGWQADACGYNATHPEASGLLVTPLFDVGYDRFPYAAEYPTLPRILADRPCTPVGNVVANNTCEACPNGFADVTRAQVAAWGSSMLNNTVV